jgi:hypothetical protein
MFDFVFGPNSISPVTEEERRGLRRIVAKRRLLWVLLLGLLPGVYLASLLPGVDPFIVGRIWIVICMVTTIHLSYFSPCPRCGSQFHMKTWYWGNSWTQHCMSCHLPLRAPATRPKE